LRGGDSKHKCPKSLRAIAAAAWILQDL
jgi:hypothetical protein